MSQYDDQIFNSDLDAFKTSGAIKVGSIVLSGNLAGGSTTTFTETFSVANLDLFEILFDSSTKHSGKYRSAKLERYTLIYETTNASELTALLEISVSGNTVTIGARLFNSYAATVTLQTTTLNIRLIPYEGNF